MLALAQRRIFHPKVIAAVAGVVCALAALYPQIAKSLSAHFVSWTPPSIEKLGAVYLEFFPIAIVPLVKRSGDDLVPLADTGGQQREVQGAGSGVHANADFRAAVRGEFLLECRHLRPQDERAVFLDTLPVHFALQRATLANRPRIGVVDEHHAVTEERAVLDRDARADEGMAGYLAVLPDFRSPLDLDERADLGPVANLTSVQIHKVRLENPYVAAKHDIGRNHARDSPISAAGGLTTSLF